jgi:hypothetical protein
VEGVTKQVDSTRLRKTLERIYGARNRTADLQHTQTVKTFIADQFAASPLEVVKQEFRHQDYDTYNIIGHIPGVYGGSKRIILCAHFDTWKDSPGADDNGSGVAGLLEAARVLAGRQFGYAIDFIAFDLEEEGAVGSQAYLLSKDTGEPDIEGVINLDMIGSYSEQANSQQVPGEFCTLFPQACHTLRADQYRANFILNAGNRSSQTISGAFSRNASRYVPDLKVLSLTIDGNGEALPGLASSDHVSFWLDGYKAIHVGVGGRTRNKHLDTNEDKMGLVNYPFMARVVQATVAALAELAGMREYAVYEADLDGAAAR